MCSHAVTDPKNSIWTESFNVPFLLRYPERIAPRVDSVLLSSVDIMPTLLSLAGLKAPESVEGRDLSGIFLGEREDRPEAALYLRNVNGEPDPDGLYRKFFAVARGIRTERYTMEITRRRDGRPGQISIYDDWNDPYQLHNIDYRTCPELFQTLCGLLRAKLEESGDVWYREDILDQLLAQI